MASLPKNILTFEEPFGDTNGRITELQTASEGYRRLLEEKIEDLKVDAVEIGKQALVIGGVIVAVYLLVDALLPEDEAEIKTKSGSNVSGSSERHTEKTSWVVKTVTSYATTWLLGLARQKLMDFLATQQNTNAGTDTNETSK
ncbi:hypothetical protein DR864_19730 [Runella rosea]|uniref:Uncharacterized protein n=1 Tax=Runella rosea TaxID=2259595 RepID=A0A344TME2_9BACT|nr:hypothetical protein [Runella rosea]AXE19813.1 hypothetical protein DR864_19730 [Runella rosea]